MKFGDTILGRFLLGIGSHSRAKVLAAEMETERARLAGASEVSRKVHAARIIAAHENYMRYPIKEMTRVQFGQLLDEENLGTGYLAACPIDTWFVCNTDPLLPGNAIVVGQVVSGMDLLSDQWGAGLSIPERGINRYRLAII